ncbi:MAG TPA: iron ABC transporter permease, partial [Burkholderiales bacterium]|nr:iron ABC transporter permease [Burkholderiales bacterium]
MPAGAVIGFGLIWAFLILFVLYPLTRIFYDAFTNEAAQFTLVNFQEFFTDRFYLRSLWNSLVLGIAAVITTSVIGIAVAFLIIRYEFPGRNLFAYLTMLPLILPPLVGVLGFVFILGRAGTVNVLLMDWFGMLRPINFMYGWHGVLLVETVHLFPLMTLSILDSLSKVDPSLEEAAQGMGARGWRRFRDITLPLMTPGYVSGALLVFIWTFADFVTPLVVGVQDLLAVQAYLNIVQFVDRRIFRMGIVISALLVLLAVIFVLVARHYVAIKDYSSLAYSKVERRTLGPVKRWLAVGFLVLLLFVSAVPQVGVVLAAVGKGWALTPFPVHYTLDYFRQVSIETPKFIVNSILFSGLAVLICLVVGVPMAWIMARTKAVGRGAMDALTTLILAIPGTAIGIAYIRAFHYPLPVIDVALTSMWFVLPLVLA